MKQFWCELCNVQCTIHMNDLNGINQWIPIAERSSGFFPWEWWCYVKWCIRCNHIYVKSIFILFIIQTTNTRIRIWRNHKINAIFQFTWNILDDVFTLSTIEYFIFLSSPFSSLQFLHSISIFQFVIIIKF